MGKYEPLTGFLGRQRASEVPVTFAEIERLIGAPLPPVARKHRAYWSNNSSNNVMTKAWLAAGFKAERVDMASGKLIFRREKAAEPSISTPSYNQSAAEDWSGGAASTPETPSGRHPLFGALKGTVTVAPGVDLTAASDELWDAEA